MSWIFRACLTCQMRFKSKLTRPKNCKKARSKYLESSRLRHRDKAREGGFEDCWWGGEGWEIERTHGGTRWEVERVLQGSPCAFSIAIDKLGSEGENVHHTFFQKTTNLKEENHTLREKLEQAIVIPEEVTNELVVLKSAISQGMVVSPFTSIIVLSRV